MAKKIVLFLIFMMVLLPPVKADINNTIAYSISNTSSTTAGEIARLVDTTLCQTVKATASETWDGVVLYLDRQGLSDTSLSATKDSTKVRFRKNAGCGTPNPQSTGVDRDVYVKVSDIPDGDATRNTVPPDSVGSGYAIWYIFSSPVTVTAESCYCILFNTPRVGTSDRINHQGGATGYADGSAYYTYNEISWTNYNYDLSFRVIKDKYSLIAIRRMPFNARGIIAGHNSDKYNSITYSDSLHRWMNTSQNVGGSWGQGLSIGWGEYGAPLWRGSNGPTQGIGGSKKYYFASEDTVTADDKDTIDAYINRRWVGSFQPFVRCGDGAGDRGCLDSTGIDKIWAYLTNHSDTWGKIYKGGVFSHSDYRRWGIPKDFGAGADSNYWEFGDSIGTPYRHSHKTFAVGKFKFIWVADYNDGGGIVNQFIIPIHWLALQDSLNVKSLPFGQHTMRDGTKAYNFYVNGSASDPHPDNLYKVCRRAIAKNASDSLHILIPHSHLNYYVAGDSGMDADDKDTLRAVADSAASWKLWMPTLKGLFNQQAASAFAQVTVDRPGGSKRRVNITSMCDWNWGSHIPDVEELRYLTFIAYAPESLIVTIAGAETLQCSTMTAQQDCGTEYFDPAASSKALRAMSWVGMYNRTAGRLVILGEAISEEPPISSGKKVMVR